MEIISHVIYHIFNVPKRKKNITCDLSYIQCVKEKEDYHIFNVSKRKKRERRKYEKCELNGDNIICDLS